MGLYAGHFDFSVPLIRTVDALYSLAECAALIAAHQEGPWLAATVNSIQGRVQDAVLRDNTLAMVRDEKIAVDLFARLAQHVPESMTLENGGPGRLGTWKVSGVYTPLRIYRYTPGQHFGPHQDQSYARDDTTRSFLTLLVYLNDDFRGGETQFLEPKQVVVPRTGTALWFQHMVVHAGARVEEGTKYVLRTDVLYSRESRERA